MDGSTCTIFKGSPQPPKILRRIQNQWLWHSNLAVLACTQESTTCTLHGQFKQGSSYKIFKGSPTKNVTDPKQIDLTFLPYCACVQESTRCTLHARPCCFDSGPHWNKAPKSPKAPKRKKAPKTKKNSENTIKLWKIFPLIIFLIFAVMDSIQLTPGRSRRLLYLLLTWNMCVESINKNF